MIAAKRKTPPLRGEIWFVNIASAEGSEAGQRAVIVVSTDARNRHAQVNTVLAIPLSASEQKHSPVHILLAASETGLETDRVARAEDITVVLKSDLVEPTLGLRRLNDKRICELAAKVKMAMGCGG